MGYLLRQMIAFLVIIMTVLVIFGIYFTTYTSRTVTDTTYEQLKGYADTVVYNMSLRDWTLQQSLDTTMAVLQNQKVSLSFLDADLTVKYPVEFDGQSGSALVTNEELEILKTGNSIRTTLVNENLNNTNQSMAVFLKPLFTSPELDFFGVLVVSSPNSHIRNSVKSMTDNLFKGFVISISISLIMSYLLARMQVNRIDRMKKATNKLAKGNFDVHLDVKNNDELDELAQDFNEMALALKESQEEIARQEERRRNLMADVAHEMRTPLTTINGLLEGLHYGAIPKNQEDKCLDLMQNETKRLIRLVNENLDYEKILTNQIKMMIRKFNAIDVLKTVIGQLEGKAEDKKDKLELTYDEEVFVYADYDRFVQIFVNIITNSIQFTEDGSIVVDVKRVDDEVIISVSDTGIGMSNDQLKNIWDRYYKADPSRKNTKYGESGLGLPIVDQLIRLHGGKIEVESELGLGTTFRVIFKDQPPTDFKASL